MNRVSYYRFVEQFLEYNDAAFRAARIFSKYLFEEGTICIDIAFSTTAFNFTVLVGDKSHEVVLPIDWLFLAQNELDTVVALKTKDELWSYVR